jgi:hypothetical protein
VYYINSDEKLKESLMLLDEMVGDPTMQKMAEK